MVAAEDSKDFVSCLTTKVSTHHDILISFTLSNRKLKPWLSQNLRQIQRNFIQLKLLKSLDSIELNVIVELITGDTPKLEKLVEIQSKFHNLISFIRMLISHHL